MGVRTVWGGVGVVVLAANASAGIVAIDNGVSGPGAVIVRTDDYGAYGSEMGPPNEDDYEVIGRPSFTATALAGIYLFVETPDTLQSRALLTDELKWLKMVEPADGNAADGLAGSHTGLRREALSQTLVGSDSVQSTFVVAADAWELSFLLTQTLVHDPIENTTELLQRYEITNTGNLAISKLFFHAHWDAHLIWDSAAPTDIVGVGTGRCYVYTRDEVGGADQRVSLANGGALPFDHYYGGKVGIQPMNGPPSYTSKTDTIFTSFGTPVTWQNHIAEVGYDLVGESMTTDNAADATMGLEWRFPLAVNATQIVVVKRVYGTSTLPCPVVATCGNGNMDPGEDCDEDSATCNALTCTTSTCGDGQHNAMAEACETGAIGASTADCNADCTVSECGDGKLNLLDNELCDEGEDTDTCNANCQPVACGDGYVNAVAGEECEAGELCDMTTCSFDFELGGGCAGCTTKQPDASWIVVMLALGFAWRRRRYN